MIVIIPMIFVMNVLSRRSRLISRMSLIIAPCREKAARAISLRDQATSNALEQLIAHFMRWFVRPHLHRCIVDQDVDAAKLVDAALHGALAAGLRCQIAWQQHRLPPSLLHYALGLLKRVLLKGLHEAKARVCQWPMPCCSCRSVL
jgi:hypothetical protein